MPGFNPNHLAVNNLPAFSSVSLCKNFVNLTAGDRVGTISGAPTARVIGGIGPCVNFAVNTADYIKFTNVMGAGLTLSSTGPVTEAAIVQFNDLTTQGYNLITQSLQGANGCSFYYKSGSGLQWFYGNTFGDEIPSPTLPLVINVPYFIVASCNPGPSGTTAPSTFAATNLLTGQFVMTSGTMHNYNSGPRGEFFIGGQDVNTVQTTGGAIAAAMMSVEYMTFTKLREWCLDPWSFWYPDV
jgi:hypothetical protein